jgi:glycosyltransferase involved in cell wall biosynthesis
MKNILICSANFDSSATGAYHFPHHLLALNTQQETYRFWVLSEDVAENRAQRNENSENYIRKVFFKHRSWLFPFLHFRRNWAYYRAIRRFQSGQAVDFVLFNQAFYGVLARLLLPRCLKMVGIVHDSFSLAPRRSNHFSLKSYLFHLLTQIPLEILSNHILDYTIANSQHIYQLILEKRGLKPDRVWMIYQSLALENIPFKPQNWLYTVHRTPLIGEGEQIPILFVKSDFISGGLPDLIQALHLLPMSFRLTVIGPEHGAEPLIAEWVRSIPNIELNFIGLTTQQTVITALYEHAILCIPARHEGLGLANIEGLAAGISVVSTRTGGIIEVLADGQAGWLAEPEDSASIAAALQACIKSPPSVRQKKSLFGRQHVEQLFDKTQMQVAFIRFFNHVLAET